MFKSTLPWYYYESNDKNDKSTGNCKDGFDSHFMEDEAGKAKRMTSDLFIDVVINLIITMLSASKIMIYIRSIETFSILSQLVLTCLYDVVPFTSFFLMWMVFFTTVE